MPSPRPHNPSQLAPNSIFALSVDPDEDLKLYVKGGAEPMTKGERADMLKAVRGGDAPDSLDIEIRAFIQRATPNRNYVRFKPGILATFAKSYEGQPFLADHNTRQLSARGGTILSSKLVHNEDESKTILMRPRLVKAWAMEGVLDGTIDRFSIGWLRGTAPVLCSVHDAPVFTECECWPGDVLDGGIVVEFVFTGAIGTEVSAVNVPAVEGTAIDSITQLDMIKTLDSSTLTRIFGVNPTGDRKMDPEILKALGLPATATLAEVLSALAAQKDKATIADATAKTHADRLAALEIERTKRESIERQSKIEMGLSSLISKGKVAPGSETEAALRRQGERDLSVFEASVSDMLASGATVTPVGASLKANGKDPVPSTKLEVVPLDGAGFLAAQPLAANWLAKAGVTKEEFEKHGAGARKRLAANYTEENDR